MANNKNVGFEESQCFNIKYEWILDNFRMESETPDLIASSRAFTDDSNISGMHWFIEMRKKKYDNTDYIGLYLNFANNTISECRIPAKFKLSIVNTTGEHIPFIDDEKVFEDDFIFGKDKCIREDVLFNEEHKLICNNTLTIFCTITALMGSETLLFESKAFEDLLKNKGSSNVTIVADGKEFPAHKEILAAHSPVFRAMFGNNMRENQTNRVEIKDCDKKTMEGFMKYIYTEKKVNNWDEIEYKLLVMADKYDMKDLKAMCEKSYFEAITFTNAVELFIFSNEFRLTKLKEKVKEFMATFAVGSTPEFKSMVEEFPDLGIEMYQFLSNL